MINQIVEINKYFRNHHIPGALLSEMSGSVKPQLPCDTRWNSQLHCIQTFIKNRPFMLLMAAQHEDVIELRIRNLIQNVGLANEVKHLNSQLKPISNALDGLQSDSASIADACEVWMDLLQEEDLAPYLKTVEKRFNQAMTPSHFLANILHPRYRGKKLKSDQITSAQEMLQEENLELVPDLMKFMCDDKILPQSLTNESVTMNVSPAVWWKSVEKLTPLNPLFCQLARKLMGMPASSASIERIFSNFGLIQTKLRNKLGIQKCAKLVFCYRMLRGKDEIEW